MRAIGSRVRSWLRLPQAWSPRLTLRLRLTLLYGGCFLAAGAALLGITYGVFAHQSSSQVARFQIRGVQLSVPGSLAAALPSGPAGAGSEVAGTFKSTNRPVAAFPKSTGKTNVTIGAGSAALLPGARPARGQAFVISRIKASSQKQLNALAHRANVAIASQRSQSLSSLLTWSGIALVLMALLSIGLGWLLAGRALRPLRTMNSRARAITEENLHQRLGLDGRRDELGELASTFDDVLARLERAFESQRRFVANASHELRTPLTIERTLLEVALANPDASAESLRHTCERVLATGAQQERLIDALLTLARGQAGTGAYEPVELSSLAGELLDLRADQIDTRQLTVRSQVQDTVVAGDPALLERLLANLLDNAIVHNVPGGWIELEIGSSAHGPSVRIANAGEVVPPQEVSQLTDPFRRLHNERTRDAAGLGLGLSIVRAIATAHGASVELTASPDGGLEVRLQFATVAAASGSVLAPV